MGIINGRFIRRRGCVSCTINMWICLRNISIAQLPPTDLSLTFFISHYYNSTLFTFSHVRYRSKGTLIFFLAIFFSFSFLHFSWKENKTHEVHTVQSTTVYIWITLITLHIVFHLCIFLVSWKLLPS